MLETMKRRLRQAWPLALACALASAALPVALEKLGLLAKADNLAYDSALVRLSPKPQLSPDIVVIAIDDETLQRVASDPALRQTLGAWPYPRSLWGEVARYLEARGARGLMFDATMDEPGMDVGNDARFADALHASKLPFFLGFLELESERFSPLPKVKAENHVGARTVEPAPMASADEDAFGEAAEPKPPSPEDIARALAFPVSASGLALAPPRGDTGAMMHPVPPLPLLLEAVSGFGLVFPEQDGDGMLRRTRFAYADETNTYVTLPVAAAADLLGAKKLELSPGKLKLGKRELAISRDGSARIDYGGRLEERFRTVPLLSVMVDQQHRANQQPPVIPDDLFRGKVVVLGGTALGVTDRKPNPFDPLAAGVTKQVALLDSLLFGGFIVDAPPWASPAFTLGVALLALLLISGLRSWPLELATLVLGQFGIYLACGELLVHRHVYLPIVTPMLGLALATFSGMVLSRAYADRDRERMRQMFSRYLSKQVVNQLVEQEKLPQLSGEQMEVTAFFSDIRGFSTFSERYQSDPRGLVAILNTYLTRVSAVLLDHGACLDKYIGDAVVCIFGAPVQYPNHAVRACQGALAAQAEVLKLREEFRVKGLPDVYTRIGLNSAVMFVGNIGSEQLFNYTAIGDGMNLASRLEGANKNYGSGIMIGPRTYELAKDFIEARELDRVRVAGKTEAVAVYELLGMKGSLSEKKRQVLRLYAQGLTLYRAARFEEAQGPLGEALALDPEDGPAQALLARCKKLVLHPPPSPFDGVVNLDK